MNKHASTTDFMAEYYSLTHGNPFSPDFRVWTAEGKPMVMTDIIARQWDGNPVLWLNSIISPEVQGTGAASMVMKKIVEMADKHGTVIWLFAAPFGRVPNALKVSQLKAWYARYGWKKDGNAMVRYPKSLAGAARVASRWMSAGQNAGKVSSIVMFDFDGTLFRSPDEPDWWDDPTPHSWSQKVESLSPPCVPGHPGSEFWNAKAVSYARSVSSDPEAFLTVITGRVPSLKRRLWELLQQQGVHADRIYYNPNISASTFKMNVFRKLLDEFPMADTIVIWENENLAFYKNALTAYGESIGRTLRVIPHPVNMPPMEATCGAGEVSYQ